MRASGVDDLRERKLAAAPLPDHWLEALERCWAEPAFAHPGGESNHQCQARVVAAIEGIVAENEGRTLALASHGNALALFLSSIDPSFGMAGWRAMRNPDLYCVRYANGRPHWDGQRVA